MKRKLSNLNDDEARYTFSYIEKYGDNKGLNNKTVKFIG